MMIQKCKKCGLNKEISKFLRNKITKSGFTYTCLDCAKIIRKNYYISNKDIILQKQKVYLTTDSGKKSRVKAINKYYEKNKSEVKLKAREHTRSRLKNDPSFRLRSNIRRRLRSILKQNGKGIVKPSTTRELTGCSWDDLKMYIESKFMPGMTWDNYGIHGWHLDHVIPLTSFDLTNPDDIKRANHYTNLQPLWAVDNIKKGNKLC